MPASGEHDNPNPTGNSPKTNPERKHPLEYGIFGFVVLTAVFTGLGAYYTRNQWKTAEDSEHQSMRSYVGLVGFSPVSHVRGQDGKEVYEIFPTWKNSGTTPTRQLVAGTSLPIVSDIPISNIDFSTQTKNPIKGLLVPQQEIQGNPFVISGIDADDAVAGRKHIYMWGRVEYNDVFPDTPRHITRFCRELSSIHVFPPDKFQINMRTCLQGDCADAECN